MNKKRISTTQCGCQVNTDYSITHCSLHAAAPAMVEAAKETLRLLVQGGRDPSDFHQLNQAIATAEGR